MAGFALSDGMRSALPLAIGAIAAAIDDDWRRRFAALALLLGWVPLAAWLDWDGFGQPDPGYAAIAVLAIVFAATALLRWWVARPMPDLPDALGEPIRWVAGTLVALFVGSRMVSSSEAIVAVDAAVLATAAMVGTAWIVRTQSRVPAALACAWPLFVAPKGPLLEPVILTAHVLGCAVGATLAYRQADSWRSLGIGAASLAAIAWISTATTCIEFPKAEQVWAGERATCVKDRHLRTFCWGSAADGLVPGGDADCRLGDCTSPTHDWPLDPATRVLIGRGHLVADFGWKLGVRGDVSRGLANFDARYQRCDDRGEVSPGNGHLCLSTLAATYGDEPETDGDVLCVRLGDDRHCSGTCPNGARPWLGRMCAKETPPEPVAVPESAETRTGNSFGCARTAAGDVWCWGDNSLGQLGQGDINPHAGLVRVPVEDVVALDVGSTHACAAGPHEVWCWGDDSYGQVAAPWARIRLDGADVVPSPQKVLSF